MPRKERKDREIERGESRKKKRNGKELRKQTEESMRIHCNFNTLPRRIKKNMTQTPDNRWSFCLMFGV